MASSWSPWVGHQLGSYWLRLTKYPRRIAEGTFSPVAILFEAHARIAGPEKVSLGDVFLAVNVL